jgi:glycosyltransferase involved in cell wall biosynthesis
MRVLLVVPWDQDWGGVASVVGNLAKHLSRNGHEVFFFNPSEANRICEKKTKWGFRGFSLMLRTPFHVTHRLRSLASFIFFFPSTLFRLLRLFLNQGIDIVNIHYPGDASIYFAICAILLRRKIVVSVHGADFFPDGRPTRIPLLTMSLLRLSHAVVAPSRAFLGDVIGIAPEVRGKGWAIHNGIDLEEFSATSADRASDTESEYLLCIAHQNEKKAIEILVNSFSLIKDDFPSLDLVLVGDGPKRSSLEKQVQQLELSGRVRFLGWKNRAEVARLLHGCRLFALPSRSEPFGIAIIEAMACKKTVVGTRVGGIPEIIQHRQNGMLVSPNHPEELAAALRELLTAVEAAKKMAEQAFVTVRDQFTCLQMGQSYVTLFQSLLADTHQRRSVQSVAPLKS